jgi:hypothetical protein
MHKEFQNWRNFLFEDVDARKIRDALEPTMERILLSDEFASLTDEEKVELGKAMLDFLSNEFTVAANKTIARSAKESKPGDKLDLSEVVAAGVASYLQKIYEINLKVAINKTKGGDREQTFTEIRGIPGVTTVSVDPTGTSRDETNYYSTLNVKFELLGNKSPYTHMKEELFPGLRRINGLRLIRAGNLKEVTPM